MVLKTSAVDEAFNSMLRADYISLSDTRKLQLLADYYVDYFGYLRQILGENDQVIVGRRGTGKTTLLYRALVECMKSWDTKAKDCSAKSRTLAIYIDLSKCHSLFDTAPGNYDEFEHVFATELHDALKTELVRSWPAVGKEPNLLQRIFAPGSSGQITRTRQALETLVHILQSGLPRIVDRSQPVTIRKRSETSEQARISLKKDSEATVKETVEREEQATQQTTYRVSIADILRALGEIRSAANISHIVLLIDELSSLNDSLQRRFSTLLRKILGNHNGIFVKLSAITDNYALGSSIILQRDLFEVSLDLDAYVENNANLTVAMTELGKSAEKIVRTRLTAYAETSAEELFDDPTHAWTALSRAAMGVPRTIGIVLKHAWNRAEQSGSKRIRRTDIDAGIRHASRAYQNQLLGAADAGAAIPAFVRDIWGSLLKRASAERAKGEADASHFMVLGNHEEKLKYLNMFFVVHLLTRGRTTKKEIVSRNVYCIDYGICLEHNLGFVINSDIMRRQRFVYDDIFSQFDKYFENSEEPTLRCPKCNSVFREAELVIAGARLSFCPKDRTDLVRVDSSGGGEKYTEEEIKIIGAMRSAKPRDELLAREVADDVGCHVQKVSKFGEKLEKDRLVARSDSKNTPGKKIYFNPVIEPEADRPETKKSKRIKKNGK